MSSPKSSPADLAIEAAWIERVGIIEAEFRSAVCSLPVTKRLSWGRDLVDAVTLVLDEQIATDANRLANEGHSLTSIASTMGVGIDALRRHVRRADPEFRPYRRRGTSTDYIDITYLWDEKSGAVPPRP